MKKHRRLGLLTAEVSLNRAIGVIWGNNWCKLIFWCPLFCQINPMLCKTKTSLFSFSVATTLSLFLTQHSLRSRWVKLRKKTKDSAPKKLKLDPTNSDQTKTKIILKTEYNLESELIQGSSYKEKVCTRSTCDGGMFTYEKTTGHFLRTARWLSFKRRPSINNNGLTCSESKYDGMTCSESAGRRHKVDADFHFHDHQRYQSINAIWHFPNP